MRQQTGRCLDALSSTHSIIFPLSCFFSLLPFSTHFLFNHFCPLILTISWHAVTLHMLSCALKNVWLCSFLYLLACLLTEVYYACNTFGCFFTHGWKKHWSTIDCHLPRTIVISTWTWKVLSAVILYALAFLHTSVHPTLSQGSWMKQLPCLFFVVGDRTSVL